MKHNLVLASVLKPVDDTRMYEKFGIPLSSLPQYHIHIIGFRSVRQPTYPNITFHPLFDFARLSWKRLEAPIEYFKKLLKLKPKVIVVNSPELLIVTVIYKILFSSEILYDVQENYYRNILYTPTYPRWLRPLLAMGMRCVEKVAAFFVLHFFFSRTMLPERT